MKIKNFAKWSWVRKRSRCEYIFRATISEKFCGSTEQENSGGELMEQNWLFLPIDLRLLSISHGRCSLWSWNIEHVWVKKNIKTQLKIGGSVNSVVVSKRSKSVLGKKSGSVGVATISIYFQMFAANPSQKRNYFCTFSSLRMLQLWKSHKIWVVAQFSNMIFRFWYLSTGRPPISTQGRPSLALFVNVSWCNLVTRYQTIIFKS